MNRQSRDISKRESGAAWVGESALRAGVVALVSFCVVVAASGHFRTGSRLNFRTAVASFSTHPVVMVDLGAGVVAITASALALARIEAGRRASAPAVIRVKQTRLVILSRIGGRHGP